MKQSVQLVYLASMLGMVGIVLAGCQELPKGISQEFHTDAKYAFVEIDDDTMEMELSDMDDLANVSLLEVQAETKAEEQVVKYINEVAKLNGELYKAKNDPTVLKEYLTARQMVIKSLDITTSKFSFTEE